MKRETERVHVYCMCACMCEHVRFVHLSAFLSNIFFSLHSPYCLHRLQKKKEIYISPFHIHEGSISLFLLLFSLSSGKALFILLPPWCGRDGSLRVSVASTLTDERIWNELWSQGYSRGLSV